MQEKASRGFIQGLGPVLLLALLLLPLSPAVPAAVLAQEPTPTAIPSPAETSAPTPPATPSPQTTPVPERIVSGEDVLGVLAPRDRRPRDNDIRFDHISIGEGLSQSSVQCILQDHKGFMWFGTEDGLNKYDGYSFTAYRHDPQDPNSLSHNYIRCLHEDGQGMIWIGTSGGGLNRFDPQSGQFRRYRHDRTDPDSLIHDEVLSIYEDRSGVMWVGTSNGLAQFDPEYERFVHYQHSPHDSRSLSDSSSLAILEDDKRTLWVGTSRGGLNRLDRDTGECDRYQHDAANPHSLSNNQVKAIFEDSKGILWVGTRGGGLNRLDRATGQFTHYRHDRGDPRSLSSDDVVSIYEDRAGVLWIATIGGGLDRFERESEEFIHYEYDPLDKQSLSHNDVWSIYEDRGGVLWIGTIGAGLNKASPANQKFAHYRHDPDDPNSLNDNRVNAILEDHEGVLWIGTSNGGLNRLDRDSGIWTHFRHSPDDADSLSHNTVRSIYEDSEGVLWLGTDAGLDQFDRQSSQFIHYRHDPQDSNSLGLGGVWPIYEDKQGLLWVGTTGGGLTKFDRASGRFTRYVYNPGNPFSLSHNQITAIHKTYDGTLWIGTMGGGLNRYDRETGRFSQFRHNPNDPYSISSDMIFCIAEDFRGRLYIGTWGAGFDRFDPRGRRFIHYREKDGLPNDVVYGIVEDKTGYLWLSTNRGLSRFNPSLGGFRNYDVSDGLQSNEFNGGAYFINSSGELFFGGINGFNVFYPPNVEDNPHVPPVVITAFRKFDRTVLTDISEDLAIELSYTDNFVAFEFAALDYAAPHKNQYTYRLQGFDPRWVDAGARRYQSYSNLRGGDYVFRVKGSNNDGVWNRDGIAIYIKVIPPVWDRWWFRGMLAVVLIGSAVAGYRLRVRSIETHTRDLESVVDERTYEIERRRVVAEGLREILVILNSDRSLKESLDYIASQAAVLTGATRAFAFRREEGTPQPVILGTFGTAPGNPEHEALPPSMAEWISDAIVEGEPLIVPSLSACHEAPPEVVASADNEHCAILGVPISVAGEVYGGLALFYPLEQRFSAEDIELGLTLADQAALAIANAQLRARVEQMAAETERSRLARDLHDAVTQTLFSASLISEVLPATWENDQDEGRDLLKELRQLSRGAMAEMRTLLLELRPAALVETRLGNLLRQLGEAVTGRTGLPVSVDVDDACVVPDDVHVALYRIAQEALNNVVKHAHANQVAVSLRCAPLQPTAQDHQTQRVVLQVGDDGRGFDPSKVPPDRLGLGIIRERAQAIGAELHLESAPGEGTTVTAVWMSGPAPLPGKDE